MGTENDILQPEEGAVNTGIPTNETSQPQEKSETNGGDMPIEPEANSVPEIGAEPLSETDAYGDTPMVPAARAWEPTFIVNGPVQPLATYEKEAILLALFETNGNVAQAAKLLEIGRATFYRKLKAMEIDGLFTEDEQP